METRINLNKNIPNESMSKLEKDFDRLHRIFVESCSSGVEVYTLRKKRESDKRKGIAQISKRGVGFISISWVPYGNKYCWVHFQASGIDKYPQTARKGFDGLIGFVKQFSNH